MDLAFDQRVIEHIAGIVDRAIGDELGMAGVGIDLDLGDMAAIRKGLRRVDATLVSRFPGSRRAFSSRCARSASVNSGIIRSVPTTSNSPLR